MIRVCCKCKRVWVVAHQSWAPATPSEQAMIDSGDATHGYCPQCFEDVKREIAARREGKVKALRRCSFRRFWRGVFGRADRAVGLTLLALFWTAALGTAYYAGLASDRLALAAPPEPTMEIEYMPDGELIRLDSEGRALVNLKPIFKGVSHES
ncbi:MAG: hypothetical protein ABFD89_15260 [Bryobacteraceae bacterium]